MGGWAHETVLTPLFPIDFHVPNNESRRLCIGVIGVLIFCLDYPTNFLNFSVRMFFFIIKPKIDAKQAVLLVVIHYKKEIQFVFKLTD